MPPTPNNDYPRSSQPPPQLPRAMRYPSRELRVPPLLDPAPAEQTAEQAPEQGPL